MLAFTNNRLPDHQETVAAVKAYAAEYEDAIAVVVADPQQDVALAVRCGVTTPLTKTDVVIMLNGRVIIHSIAPRDKAAVADAFQYALVRSRCPCAR